MEKVVSDGLGPRWIFMSLYMAAYLNANEMVNYLERHAQGKDNISIDCVPLPKYGGEVAQQIVDAVAYEVLLDKFIDKGVRSFGLIKNGPGTGCTDWMIWKTDLSITRKRLIIVVE